MKTTAILSALLIVMTTGFISAQDTGNKKNKLVQKEIQVANTWDPSVLDKLQKETEDISIMKPLFFLAQIIEGRLQLHKMEKIQRSPSGESMTASKAREVGIR